MSTGLPGPSGDPTGKVLVDTIIAHKSFSAQDYNDILDPENFSRADANHLLYGQRAVTQQTNARFAKYVTKIEVLTEPAAKWDAPLSLRRRCSSRRDYGGTAQSLRRRR